MAAKAHIHAKVDPSLKEEVGKILEELGLNFTDAITQLGLNLLYQR